MKKSHVLLIMAALLAALPGTAAASDETEMELAGDVIEIATVDDLKAVNDQLSGNYVLIADIDLGGEEWVPLGSFVQAGTEGEAAETPDLNHAFTGTFDGQGHTISNFVINQPESWALGLFGCIANTEIGNFTVENAVVDGTTMVSAVVGYTFCSTVSDVTVENAVITAHETELSEEGMYGAVAGAGMMSTLKNCAAAADITIPDGTANAGIVGGGLEMTSVIGCQGTGTITTGNNCYGLGGISGCGFGSEEFTDCTAQDVVISCGDNCFWIGGITGYAGGFEDEAAGVPVTDVSGCTARNVAVSMGAGAYGYDTIVGAGFFYEGLAEAYGMEAYANPTVFVLQDCQDENVTFETAEGAVEEAETLETAEGAVEEAEILETAEEAVEAETGAEAAEETGLGVWPAIAGENGITYDNFFDVTLAEENYDLWYDCTAAIVGETAAADTVDFMQGYISSDLYGEEAIAYYSENPDAQVVFDCFYINGVKKITFRPDFSAAFEMADGSTQTYNYEYIGVYTVGAGETMVYMGQEINVEFPCDVYQSTEEAGEFNYLFLRDDTMEETGHIEFRYGKDLEELQGYFTGPYAYWLTAGFDEAADEATLRSTVELFCLENMDYSSHSEEALSQIDAFMGTWTADLSGFGDAYADTELYFTIDEAGHGITMMDGQQTADFEAYAFDNGEKGDGKGIYIAYSNLEYEAEAAEYTLTENENGETVLTLYATDGTISYIKTA